MTISSIKGAIFASVMTMAVATVGCSEDQATPSDALDSTLGSVEAGFQDAADRVRESAGDALDTANGIVNDAVNGASEMVNDAVDGEDRVSTSPTIVRTPPGMI